MVYLIYGNQTIRIKSQLKAIVKKVIGTPDELNFVRFDFLQTPLGEIIDDLNHLPLGYEHKIVVLDNALFLGKDKYKDKLNEDDAIEELKKCVLNENSEVDLVLLLPTSNIDKKNEIYLSIEKNGSVFYIEDPNAKQWIDIVKLYMEKQNVKIDYDALKELSNRTLGDYSALYSNGQKLALYTDHIHYDDVTLMVSKPLEENTFAIFNNILDGQNIIAVSIFKDLKVNNVEPVVLVSQLATSFRTLGEVLFLFKKGLDNDAVATELGIKPIRATIMHKYLYTVSEDCIRSTLDKLYDLDLQIKSGQVDRYYAFELFLVNFKKY